MSFLDTHTHTHIPPHWLSAVSWWFLYLFLWVPQLLGWSLLAIFFIYTRCLSSRSSGGNTSSHQQRRSPHPHSSFPSPTSLSLSTATAMGQHRSSHLVDRSAVGTPIDKSL